MSCKSESAADLAPGRAAHGCGQPGEYLQVWPGEQRYPGAPLHAQLPNGLFFEGWVKRLCEAQAHQGLIYAVYAGAMIFPDRPVGSHARPGARDHRRLCCLHCRHPGLHLSAGLAFISGKYPIYQAADDAGEMLERPRDCPQKCLCFLGPAMVVGVFQAGLGQTPESTKAGQRQG